jgi:hypothetical protein
MLRAVGCEFDSLNEVRQREFGRPDPHRHPEVGLQGAWRSRSETARSTRRSFRRSAERSEANTKSAMRHGRRSARPSADAAE